MICVTIDKSLPSVKRPSFPHFNGTWHFEWNEPTWAYSWDDFNTSNYNGISPCFSVFSSANHFLDLLHPCSGLISASRQFIPRQDGSRWTDLLMSDGSPDRPLCIFLLSFSLAPRVARSRLAAVFTFRIGNDRQSPPVNVQMQNECSTWLQADWVFLYIVN